MSGSQTGHVARKERDQLQTPRANPTLHAARRTSSRYPRTRSSVETLKPELFVHQILPGASMASPQPEYGLKEAVGEPPASGTELETPLAPTTPKKETSESNDAANNPATPPKVTFKEPARTPRLKKKVPWKGKHIMVLLPRDYEQGQPGRAARPLSAAETERMYRSWEELGYSTHGFDLDAARGSLQEVEGYSQSRDAWPTTEDLDRERASQPYKVTLPDLNGEWGSDSRDLGMANIYQHGRIMSTKLMRPNCAPLASPSAKTNQSPRLRNSPGRPPRSIRLCPSLLQFLLPRLPATLRRVKGFPSQASSRPAGELLLLRALAFRRRPRRSRSTRNPAGLILDSPFLFPWVNHLSSWLITLRRLCLAGPCKVPDEPTRHLCSAVCFLPDLHSHWISRLALP